MKTPKLPHKRQHGWYYRELFRFLLKLDVVELSHGQPMKYFASFVYKERR